MNRLKQPELLLYAWFIVFFISTVCCFRAVSSISIGLILLTGIFKNKMATGAWQMMHTKNRFLISCCLFYMVQVIMLLYTGNFNGSASHLQTQTAIFFIPLAICCSNYIDADFRHRLMAYYVYILAAALLYCLLIASGKYYSGHASTAVFFYHELVFPFRQHAVQVAIMVFAGLVHLLELAKNDLFLFNKRVHFFLVVYFTGCILLLSSRLVIVCMAGSFVYYFVLAIKAKLHSRLGIFVSLLAGLAMILLVLSTQNNISKRFNEIWSGNINLVQQKEFSPDIYFNGLQFRLLQWRFVQEILSEQHAWLTGVADDAQKHLDEKYTSTHMYTGDANSATRGYLGYNTHDQFLQSLLQSGIPGVVVFTLICCSMIGLAIQAQDRELTLITALLIGYCFNEAVFETQYGITLFTFFPLFFYYGAGKAAVIQ